MIRIIRRISTIAKDGKAEVLVTPVASKPYPHDIPTGIFVDTRFFRRGDIYINCNDIHCRTMQQMEEGRASKKDLDVFCRRLYNIVRVTEDLETPITMDHIKKIFSTEQLQKTGNWIKRESLCRILELPLPSRGIRYSNHRKLYDFVLDYLMKGTRNYRSIELIMPTLRELYRFEMFKRIVRKEICFSLNVDTITEKDLHELHLYFEKEHEYMVKYPEQMREVIKKTDEVFPRSLHPGIRKNRKEQANRKMAIVKRIMAWLLEERETSNNPFCCFEIGKVTDPDTMVSLLPEEIKELCTRDYKGQGTRTLIRDLFLFQCHTGIRYQDLRYLEYDNLEKEKLTYKPRRMLYSIYPPVTDVHLDKRDLELISSHKGEDEGNRLFCCPRETQYDLLLKVVFKDCGLDRMVPCKNKASGRITYVHLYEMASSILALHTYHADAKGGTNTGPEAATNVKKEGKRMQVEACRSLIEMLE